MMKKFFVFLGLLMVGTANAGLSEIVSCNQVEGYKEDTRDINAVIDSTTAFYLINDGDCPSRYLKIALAKSMMETPGFYGFLYAPKNTDICDSKGCYQFSSICGDLDENIQGDTGDVFVEWLKGNGTNYIGMVGISITSNTGVYVDFTRTDTTSGIHSIIGVKQSTSNDRSEWFVGYESFVVVVWNTGIVTSTPAIPNSRYNVAMNFFGSGNVVVNGTTYTTLSGQLVENDHYDAYPYIFAFNSRSGASRITSDKIHNIKITNGGELVYDLVPMRRNGVCGLYDREHDNFYGNENLTCG